MDWISDPVWGCRSAHRDTLPCDGCTCHHAEPRTQPAPSCGWGGWLPCMNCRPGCGYYPRHYAQVMARRSGRWEDGAPYRATGNCYGDAWEPEPETDDGIGDHLNPQQEVAAAHVYGPVLVLAGAGSGKTRTLTVRVERLLDHVATKEVCAITFTREAARQMRNRICGRLGDRANGMVITTFHSLALGICREHPELVNRAPGFSVWDDQQQGTEFRRIFQERWAEADPRNPRKLPVAPSDVLKVMGDLKGQGRPFGDVEREFIAEACHPVAAIAASEYEEVKVAANAMDYDDLIWSAVCLLESHDQICASYQERWKFLLVDEYQDTNDLQERLLKCLAGPEPNLMVVGDEDQAIYGFRGSNVAHILSFTDRYPGAVVLELGANYRCSPQILRCADALVRHNVQRRDKRLWSEMPDGEPVLRMAFRDPMHEAQYVARMISGSIEKGRDPAEHAVLCRTRRQMIPIQHQLAALGIEHRTVGAIELWQRSDVKLMIMWLKTVVNPLDIGAGAHCMTHWPRLGAKTISTWKDLVNRADGKPMFALLPRLLLERGCGPSTVKGKEIERFQWVAESLVEYAREGASLREMVRWLYGVTGLDAEIELARNSSGLVAQEGAKREQLKLDFLDLCPGDPGNAYDQIQAFLDAMLLNAKRSADTPSVVVSTIHGAKGLEWDNVWVPGLVEGLLPYSRAGKDGRPVELPAEQAEEERRLCYVAFTRARHRLVVTTYKIGREGEREVFMQPSRFLAESEPPKKAPKIDEEHIAY